MNRLDPLTVPLQSTNLIEASAGTGKTYTLTTLYLRLLLELRLDVGEILVVTYTNAATAELRDRIRRRLRGAMSALQAGGEVPDETLRTLLEPYLGKGKTRAEQLLAVALRGFDNAAVFTIHGFCQRMLQDHAFESRVSFDAELMADMTALRDEVVRDFWASRLYDAPEELLRFLGDQKVSPAALTKLARKIESHPGAVVLPRYEESTEGASDDDWAARALSLQLELAAYSREETRRRMEESNAQSFDDLLQRLDEALAGPGGASLARSIRKRFPAALIDEFQDTDPTQYRIFRRAYHDAGATLFLIGDPKQAIYAFRGADVFTYIDAKHDAAQRAHTLEINWRSDPGLLRAVNTLFGRAALPFLFDDIPFVSLGPAPDAVDTLSLAGQPQAPFRILFFRGEPGHRGRGGRRINKGPGEPAVCVAIAREITRFLHSGATIDGRPVEPADIAVLCRTNDQARQVQEQLRRCRVPSALQGDASVFDSPEAEELNRILRPVADPGDLAAFRAALSTSTIGLDAEQIYALQDDERAWNEWAERFTTWHRSWLRHGFMPAFRRLLDDCGATEQLLGLVDGERRVTNLLHLGELLHRAAVEQRLGPLALVEWLALMRQDLHARQEAGSEAAQIRLESDTRAAKLTTIHKSKGLEYPIVYCPFTWDGKGLHSDDKRYLLFHDPDDGNRLKLDLGSAERDEHLRLAERELLAENLRLLYVALTRAKHRCSVVWGPFNQFEETALGYLLHQPDRTRTSAKIVAAAVAKMNSLDDDAILADLDRLVQEAEGFVEVAELAVTGEATYSAGEVDTGTLSHREATRRVELTSRTSSFSRLVAAGAVSQPAEEGIDYDEAHVAEEIRPTETGAVALNEFPAGARPGQLLHGILEHLDFASADSEEARALVARMLSLYRVEDTWTEPLQQAIVDVLATPLDEAPQPLRLQSIESNRRLNELQFLFPVAGSLSPATAGLTSGALAAAFDRHGCSPLPDGYAARVRQLGFAPLAGYLTGFIDLVFEHDGRWYLVDYKSNHLGPHAADYALPRLVDEMSAHHYFLQYHLYVVALHRYLSLRLADYDYDRHFGGVYYLFLRGMSARHPFGRGVFYDRPPRVLVEALSEAMAQPLERGVSA